MFPYRDYQKADLCIQMKINRSFFFLNHSHITECSIKIKKSRSIMFEKGHVTVNQKTVFFCSINTESEKCYPISKQDPKFYLVTS